MTCLHEPFLAGFDPLAPGYLADPYPVLGAARAAAPVFYAPAIDMWVVTSHEAIATVFADPATFSAGIAQDPLFPLGDEARRIVRDGFGAVPVMSNLDPPGHSRVRRRLAKAFSPKRSAAMGPSIEALASGLIDGFAARGSADLVAELCYPLPALTIFRLLGFPPADADRLKAWCGNKLEFNWGRPSPEDQVAAAEAMVAFWRYCQAFVTHRSAEPADDLTSALLEGRAGDPEALTDVEIASILFGLSFAGHETTTNLLANALRQTLAERGRWARLVEQRDTIPAVVEETLRYDSSVIAWRRVTTRDTTLAGCALPAGARLMLVLGAANRDPAVFADPDRFDPGRGDARSHLSFGKGIHYCLGAPLARLESTIVLGLLADRLPRLRLTEQQPTFPPNISFRGPRALHARWDVPT